MTNKWIDDARKYLLRYDFFRRKLENLETLKAVFNHKASEEEIITMHSYVNLIESTLKQLQKDERQLLIEFFVKKKHRSEFNYSTTSFYRALKKACANFFQTLGIYFFSNNDKHNYISN
ncbi:MG284/MPN403 family protein [Mycoplasma sp. E35C]|uniref:MG284/MPN403 family protein n=1 Tax=Mycoplasma sp. E35C TaxID=2801918 RepID=UPI001CA3B2FA|nr:hypothetical protein [Mycoplasma sp. E35C]QZX49332.1 hypothetical protein JJE79_01090 [Mycoplasma sp. E35C]